MQILEPTGKIYSTPPLAGVKFLILNFLSSPDLVRTDPGNRALVMTHHKQEASLTMYPKTILVGFIALSAVFISSSATVAAPKEKASGSWDGTWSGISSAGGRTTVKIAGGKVTYWTNNGFPRPAVTGSVKGNTVSLDDNNGWKATITSQGNDKARITASGMGNNGKPAKNSTVLVKK